MPQWLRVASAMAVVGWGANQFAALLPVYRETGGLGASFVSLAFTMYAVGLVPALLLAAGVADRVGLRVTVRSAVVLSGCASLLLAIGTEVTWSLLLGRALAGTAMGLVLGPATAWVTDLSADAALAPRRVAVALSVGFGGGPLVAGIVAQWAPAPELLPYLLQIVLAAVVGAASWNVSDASPAAIERDSRPRGGGLLRALASPAFLGVIPVTAPWVFGTATMSFAVVPSVVDMPGYDAALDGLMAGATLGTGVLVQPFAQWLERRRPGAAMRLGLALAGGGMAFAAAAFATGSAVLLVPIALVFGSSYGLVLVAGLRRVEVLAEPEDRARMNAIFYSLAYIGFAVPLVFSLVAPERGEQIAFAVAGAASAMLTVVWVALRPRGLRAPTAS
jgi:hypothetical protein